MNVRCISDEVVSLNSINADGPGIEALDRQGCVRHKKHIVLELLKIIEELKKNDVLRHKDIAVPPFTEDPQKPSKILISI